MKHGLALLALITSSFLMSLDTPSPQAGAGLPAEVKVEAGTSRAWALATSAVLIERNGGRHDVLAGMTVDLESVKTTKKMLEDSWDIKTKDHLLQQLEWVATVGHRGEYTKRFQEMSRLTENELDNRLKRIEDGKDRDITRAIWKNAKRALKLKGGIAGWDYSRFVALCRWGYAAGYITEEEAWKRMEPIAKEIQKTYASWEDLGEAFCIVRDCFRPGENEPTEKAFEKLKTDESSPWKTTSWNLKLGKLDKPEKPPEPKKKP